MQRIVIVLLYDALGRVDAGMRRYLQGLRPHGRVHVVVNGALRPDARAALAGLADHVLERENTGFDVGAYRAAIDEIGPRRLARFDELVLTNSTNFGPVASAPGRAASFDHVFARMDARDVDVWGMTEHAALTPNPYTFRDTLPAHLQSNWLAVRARVLQSAAWNEYWATMPPIASYDDSVRHHEARFTSFFAEAGFRHEAVFPAAAFGVANPSVELPLALLRAGCPLVKRRLFFHDPVELDHRAVDAPEVARAMAEGGVGAGEVLSSLGPVTAPRTLAASLGGVRTLRRPVRRPSGIGPDGFGRADTDAVPLTRDVEVVGGLRVRRVDGSLWRRLAEQPGALLDDVDLLVSRGESPVLGALPPAEPTARAIAAAGAGGFGDGAPDASGAPTAHARAGGARATAPGASGATGVELDRPADPAALRAARDAATTLLGDPEPIAWAFLDDPAVGAIVPLTPHIGTETLGHGWLGRREAAADLAARLGLEGPLDEAGPAAPYSAIAAYRTDALRQMAGILRAQGGWGAIAATVHGGSQELERLLDLLASRVVLSAGFVTIEAGTQAQLETSLAHLQAKHAEVAGMLPTGVREPIRYLRARQRGALSPEALGETLMRRAPKFAQSLRAAIARWRS